MHRFSLASLFVAALFAFNVEADTTIDYRISGADGGDLSMVIAGQRAAMQMNTGGSDAGRFVFDGEADKMWMVMDSEKQYMDMEQMMAGLSGLSGMLSGMMENMPEGTKSQLGGLFGNKKESDAPAIEKTGDTDVVAGIECDLYNTSVMGATTEVCIADPGDLDISASDFETLNRMMEKQMKMAQQMSEILGSDALSFGPASLEGVPLRSRQTGGAGKGEVTELQGVSQEADASVLQIPDGYELVAMPGA